MQGPWGFPVGVFDSAHILQKRPETEVDPKTMSNFDS